MGTVGQIERRTQDRVVNLFRDHLGYEYGGNLEDAENSNIDESKLLAYLSHRGYGKDISRRAIQHFVSQASMSPGSSLYDTNRKVYELLRYGVKVKADVTSSHETVWLIDWESPEENNFTLAEEVTIRGERTKRPDIVLSVNGIALAILELKRSKVSVSEGIRQNLGNQRQDFIRPFFSTIQFVFAGNDVEGLKYGVIETPEKYWLSWKEPESSTVGSGIEETLDKSLAQMCSKQRLLDLIHNFMVFDSGTKKTARHNQFFGVHAAQGRIQRREGGIIWHTQGSGKSLTMVWLAKWIRENQSDSRVLIITDRTELDEQIETVFAGVNESIVRSETGLDLLGHLQNHQPWLLCSLVHKFRSSSLTHGGDSEESEIDVEDFLSGVPSNFNPKGDIIVFVDEAHRTQSGKLHTAMKKLLPNALFIGFTGTPLLKADTATSIETFGSFIHTYKFDEAVTDGVVLDLRYEARNIDQTLTSPTKVDQWFEARTRGMTDLSKADLKKRWGTMQKVVSAEPRAKQIVQDILLDMETMPRLMDRRGNAILVSESVYQACKFYEMFVQAGYRNKVAIVTSYQPRSGEISKEDSGEGDNEEIRKFDIYRSMLADHFGIPADQAVNRIEEFEKNVKRSFIDSPGQMRLLIVVDKLLTGFDAPSATYLYIDKKMRDHGLFQAICRVNRLDGDDKTYGYVIDYRDLFKSLESAIQDYTSGALDGYSKDDIEGLLKDRTEQERMDLDEALEVVRSLCEPVRAPKGTLQYQHYFCAREAGNANEINENEGKRVDLYKSVAKLVRTYAVVANSMDRLGYSQIEAESIKQEVSHFVAVRDEVRLGAGENVDLKQFEVGMRALLDTYIQASPSEQVATFEQGLVSLIVQRGALAVESLPAGIRNSDQAVAETIINNVRRTIIDEQAMNPRYYDKMSQLLDALIDQRNKDSEDYALFLQKLLEFAAQVGRGESDTVYPQWATTNGMRALYDFGFPEDIDPLTVFEVIQGTKTHGWTESRIKERALSQSISNSISGKLSSEEITRLISILKANHEFH